MEKLNGLIAASFTPYKDGEINIEPIVDYVQGLAQNGVSGVFVNGTTGESLSLAVAERLELAEAWLDATVETGMKVIVHVGHNSLPACQRMAEHAQEKGAAAFSAMAPTFFKPNLDGLVDYVARIASAAPELPFYFYHMPAMTGISFPMADFLKKAEGKIPNLAGIKFTFENLMDYKLCMEFSGRRFDMVFGRDEILLCGLTLGAKSGIGSTYNFAAPLYLEMIKAFGKGNREAAEALQLISMKVVDHCLKLAPEAPLSALRALTAHALGLDLGVAREPLSAMSDEKKKELVEAVEKDCGEWMSCLVG